ncbi:Lrp/AsnC family transcriptional regulator [Neptuniibacter caesariensis]|uniref:Transcriptional regulator, AsnC family protein n=1 Tax=Neptuniibacter caesariensis TaxID=207954 RepID=A0A7U8GTQ5_NEPCE|nr:Lrp/AsnC family transcriptional regulator [Neptuniibacter caesariensis]EAR62542.1 transcriptional regulator, AsnC family protein [Oceanospirillum sp. MED92] [Neptuniibacter caesariensis]
MKLTQRDRKILKLLAKDSRLANTEIAEQVGMSASACWRRIKALEEAGIINRYAVVLDEKKAGLNFRAIVMVSLNQHERETGAQFEQAMSECEAVVECFATTGQEDYNMLVVCEDIQAYNEFLDNKLFKLGTVASVQTNVILKEITRSGLGI